MVQRLLSKTLVVTVCLTLGGACARAGAGHASTPSGSAAAGEAARFSWRSGFDAGQGELKATLASGEVYSGPFAQVRADIGTNTTGAHFLGWSSPAWASDPWYGGPPKEIHGANTPKLVAKLQSASGTPMRCVFELNAPDRGIAGGGTGHCQIGSDPTQLTAQLDS